VLLQDILRGRNGYRSYEVQILKSVCFTPQRANARVPPPPKPPPPRSAPTEVRRDCRRAGPAFLFPGRFAVAGIAANADFRAPRFGVEAAVARPVGSIRRRARRSGAENADLAAIPIFGSNASASRELVATPSSRIRECNEGRLLNVAGTSRA